MEFFDLIANATSLVFISMLHFVLASLLKTSPTVIDLLIIFRILVPPLCNTILSPKYLKVLSQAFEL